MSYSKMLCKKLVYKKCKIFPEKLSAIKPGWDELKFLKTKSLASLGSTFEEEMIPSTSLVSPRGISRDLLKEAKKIKCAHTRTVFDLEYTQLYMFSSFALLIYINRKYLSVKQTLVE